MPSRPRTRGECHPIRHELGNGRLVPCPFVSCRWNLHLDHADSENGRIHDAISLVLADGPVPQKTAMRQVERLTGCEQPQISTVATSMGIVRLERTWKHPSRWALPERAVTFTRALRLKIVREYDPDGAYPSCVLDEADGGGMSQVEVATALGVTRQNIQQIEKSALGKMADIDEVRMLHQGHNE